MLSISPDIADAHVELEFTLSSSDNVSAGKILVIGSPEAQLVVGRLRRR